MESLIITVLYNKHKQLAELFPITQVINLKDLSSINYFKNDGCIAIVIDIDHLPQFELSELVTQTKHYHSKVIFTSCNEEALSYLSNYGVVVDNEEELVANKILGMYAGIIRQKHGSYVFDYEKRTISNADTVYKVQNTPFLIFNHLVKNANRTCTRNELIQELYCYEIEEGLSTVNSLSDVRSIDVHIHNLRKTIDDKRIKTIVNEGYMYEDEKLKKK